MIPPQASAHDASAANSEILSSLEAWRQRVAGAGIACKAVAFRAGDTAVEVDFIHQEQKDLQTGRDANLPTRGPLATNPRPYPQFSSVTLINSLTNSDYDALQAQLRRRIARSQWQVSYTFSKSLSSADISSVGGGAYIGGIQDYFNLTADKSPSGFDIRHRLSVAAIYDLPFLKNAKMGVVRTLLGGWQLGTIITEQTGFGASMGGSGDTTGTGVGSRLTVVPGQSVNVPNPNRDKWFNTAAFMNTPLGQWGNNARIPIHLPGMNNVDASATKNFRFRERANVQFRAEFFNFFNHVNLGAPGTSLQAPNTFGRITSASQGAGVATDGRVIQLGLKAQF